MVMGEAFRLVDELKIKIEQLLEPSDCSLSSDSQEILDHIYDHLESFEEIAKTTLDTDLDRLIGVEVAELEYCIVNDIIDSKSESNGFSLKNLKQRIKTFTCRLRKEKRRCADGLYNLIPTEEEGDDDSNGDVISSKVIGVSDVYQELKDKLMSEEFVSLVGMPGVGKTTLANKLFHDPVIVERFDHRAWVRMGKKYRVEDIPRRILAEIDPDYLRTLPEEDEEAVHEYLKASLKSKRYLIVLEDVWDRFAMYLLHHRYTWRKLDHPLLHPKSESRILLTSRLKQRQKKFRTTDFLLSNSVTIRLLNKEESWDLLCDKVFHNGSSCPPQLEKAGKKISENCDGLPLTIVTVARLLSREYASTPECWNVIAAKKNHQLFTDAYDEISKVLLPSYTYLPPLLQFCFLYVGLFPRNQEIPRTKLINLWVVDGFLELNVNIIFDRDALNCLEELVGNNVVMVYKKSSYNTHSVKTCGLHSSLLHLSRQKVKETKFAFVLSNPSDCLGDGIEGRPRLSFNNNVLFAFKDVHKFVEDKCASVARSLLCFGLYHQYQVPLCFRLKLLKELDALSIRFYEFPMEVLQLVRLRYLGLTSNGMIPPTISQLSRLQFLIVERHQNIRSSRHQSYLPLEIWGLHDLKHLQVMGSDLPDPCGAKLKNLSKLLNVSVRSCTKAVFEGTPDLKVLKIRVELTPNDDGKALIHHTNISYHHQLIVFKCVIVNPEVVPTVVPISISLGSLLAKLSLSGMGYHWEKMKMIASLPNLLVLKLKNYAFQGLVWKVEEGDFPNLGSLVIEDTDLVDWQLGSGAFENLQSLTMKCCFKLEKIHGEFGKYLDRIELTDCKPSCVEEIKALNVSCTLDVHSSWEDGKLKTTRYTLKRFART